MDAFADSDIGFAVCTWDTTEEYCQCRLGTAMLPTEEYSFLCPPVAKQPGVYFEGFYLAINAPNVTLALSILICSSSSRRSSSFTLESQLHLSIFDISLGLLVSLRSFISSLSLYVFRFLIGYSGYFYEIQCIFWTCGIWNGNGYSHFLSEKRIANLFIENQWRFIELNYWISSPNRMREKFLLILTNGTGMCVIRSNLRNYAFYDESAEVKRKGGERRKKKERKYREVIITSACRGFADEV